MNKGKDSIDDDFVLKLFASSTFRHELTRFHNRENSLAAQSQAQSQLLADSYRESIARESFSLNQTYSQISKEIDSIKFRLQACESSKTECSSAQKEKPQDLSLFSQVSIDWDKDQKRVKCLEERRMQESSFIGSFLMDSGAKELREQMEQKLKSSVLNLSGDLAKFESGVEQRLKNIEGSLNKKIENIYKTLSNLIESMNEVQKGADKGDKGAEKGDKGAKEKLNNSYFSRLIAGKLNTQDKVDKPPQVIPKEQKEGTRRRSFLGFNL